VPRPRGATAWPDPRNASCHARRWLRSRSNRAPAHIAEDGQKPKHALEAPMAGAPHLEQRPEPRNGPALAGQGDR